MRGQEYDELVDELIAALRERYGARMLLHWEDFNVRNSFRLLDKYVAQVMIKSLSQAVAGLLSSKLFLAELLVPDKPVAYWTKPYPISKSESSSIITNAVPSICKQF